MAFLLINGPAAVDNLTRGIDATHNAGRAAWSWIITDQDWSGNWTNEGQLLRAYMPPVYIDLRLEVTGGYGNGFVSSRWLEETVPLTGGVMVSGPVKGDVMAARVRDIIQGEWVDLAELRIQLDGDNLDVLTVSQTGQFFPERFSLWRGHNQPSTDTRSQQPVRSPERRQISELTQGRLQ